MEQELPQPNYFAMLAKRDIEIEQLRDHITQREQLFASEIGRRSEVETQLREEVAKLQEDLAKERDNVLGLTSVLELGEDAPGEWADVPCNVVTLTGSVSEEVVEEGPSHHAAAIEPTSVKHKK